MSRVQTYDFRLFCRGQFVETGTGSSTTSTLRYNAMMALSGILVGDVQAYPAAVPASTNIQSAFDPVIAMLQSLAYPVAFTCLGWSCLEAMIGKPASAVSRAKWAIIGYLAMRYVPALLKAV